MANHVVQPSRRPLREPDRAMERWRRRPIGNSPRWLDNPVEICRNHGRLVPLARRISGTRRAVVDSRGRVLSETKRADLKTDTMKRSVVRGSVPRANLAPLSAPRQDKQLRRNLLRLAILRRPQSARFRRGAAPESQTAAACRRQLVGRWSTQ